MICKQLIRKFVGAALLALIASAASTSEAQPVAVADINKDGLRVRVGEKADVSIDVDGVPFSRASSLYIVKPDWTGRYYGYEDDKSLAKRIRTVVREDGASVVEWPVQASDGAVTGTQKLELFPGRRLRISTNVSLTTDVTAGVEHRIGKVQPSWVSGRGFTAVDVGGKVTTATAGSYALREEFEKNQVAEKIESLTIDGRHCRVEIVTSGTAKVCLNDYRKNRWANGEQYFWFGIFGGRMQIAQPLLNTVDIAFSVPAGEASEGVTKRASAPVIPVSSALAPEVVEDRILPTPKSVKWGKGGVALSPKTRVIAAADAEAGALLADLLERDGGVQVAVTTSAKERVGDIVLSLASGNAKLKGGPEAYAVRFGEVVKLEANTTQGLRNAVHTLRQLVRRTDGVTELRRAQVEDWPTLPWRGVHFFSGRNAGELQTRMIRDIVGALKYNTLVYQVDYLNWKSVPELRHPTYGMDVEEALQVAGEARKHGMEIVPLVNTFGHSEWLLENDAFRHLADNPASPYAYDPSNPQVYELCGKIYDEAIALFQPRVFHIGHDEITIKDFPFKEANKKVGATQLIINDIQHYYDFLKARGIATMMWADMFIAPGEAPDAAFAPSREEAVRRRGLLPKDIIFADWHYEPIPVEKFTSLCVLAADGFPVIGCTWATPQNIWRHAQAVARAVATPCKASKPGGKSGPVMGLMQTTWAGYSFDEKSLLTEADQYAAYVLAAEAAWTGGGEDVAKVAFDFRTEFVKRWTRGSLPPDSCVGWVLDLSPVANLPLAAKAGSAWLGYLTNEDMRQFPTGAARLGRFMFRLPGNDEQPAAVLLTSKLNHGVPPIASLTLDVGTTASALVFATAATFVSDDGSTVAQTRIVYADGTERSFAWRLGENVFPLEESADAVFANIIRRENQPGLMARNVRAYVWENPDSAKEISSIEFTGVGDGSALILFGVTGLQSAEPR